MQPIEKKKRRSPAKRERLILLALCVVALAAVLLLTWRLSQPRPVQSTGSGSLVETVYAHAPEEVVGLTIHRSGEPAWTLQIDPDSGCFRLAGEDGYLLSAEKTLKLQEAASVITVEQVISSDPAEYTEHLPEFGLEPPDCTAVITFADGTVRTMHIGSRAAHTTAWYYMTLEDDDRLFALSTGMVEALFVSQESLHSVTQPTLHKVRIDRLTLRNGDGSIRAEWTLQCAIDETDAAERWRITAPFSYPADAEAVSSLLTNAANLRLGAYVGPATAENLTLCGFDEPRQIIEIHMAEGSIGTPGWDGTYTITDWPESTVTFVIGGARSDMVDYVRYEDAIYVSSHFTMGVFMDVDPTASMNRYPVLVALGNLAGLRIDRDGETVTYALTRSERVAPNNDLVYDEDGNLVWDTAVTRNGEPRDFAAFEAAYTRLTGVSVAGSIPADDTVEGDPHTVYTFTDVDGTVHTVALTSYGVLHDAVSVDGHQAFYLEKGVFALDLD